MKKYLFALVALVAFAGSALAQTTGEVKEINQKEFATLFKGETIAKPAIIDFNATWCGPCRRLAPILAEMAKEYSGQIEVYSIDVDQNRELAKQLGIQSIPYLLFIDAQGNTDNVIGLMTKEDLMQLVQSKLLTK